MNSATLPFGVVVLVSVVARVDVGTSVYRPLGVVTGGVLVAPVVGDFVTPSVALLGTVVIGTVVGAPVVGAMVVGSTKEGISI